MFDEKRKIDRIKNGEIGNCWYYNQNKGGVILEIVSWFLKLKDWILSLVGVGKFAEPCILVWFIFIDRYIDLFDLLLHLNK